MVASSAHRGVFRPPKAQQRSCGLRGKVGKHQVIGSRLFGETRGGGKVVNKPKPPNRNRANSSLSPSKRDRTPAADLQQQITTDADTAAAPQERSNSNVPSVPTSLSLVIQPDERAQGFGWQICQPAEKADWDNVGIGCGSVLSFLQEERANRNAANDSGSPQAEHESEGKEEAKTESCSQCNVKQLGEDFHRQSLEVPLVC